MVPVSILLAVMTFKISRTVYSAIHFSYGYALVPPDVYFDPSTGGFTVMAWVKLSSLDSWMRFIDFGNAQSILVGINTKKNLIFVLRINGVDTFRKDYTELSVSSWFHFSISVSITMSKVTFYLDGANEISHILPG